MKMFKKRKKTNSKRRVNLRSQINFSPKNHLWMSLVIFFAVFTMFLQLRISYLTTEKSLQKKLLLKREIEFDILPMRLEERYLTRLEVVEKIAKEILDLNPPQKNQIRKIIIK